MAMFSESLCEEVIRTEGRCGLSKNEKVQMARFALRQIKTENPWKRQALRYLWVREQSPDKLLGIYMDFPGNATPEEWDAAIDKAMSGTNGSSAAEESRKEK